MLREKESELQSILTMTTALYRRNLNKPPIDDAIDAYGDRIGEMVCEFLQPHRYLYSGDDFFVMAYPHILSEIIETESKQELIEIESKKTLDDIDVWCIHFFAGDIKRLFEIAPFELPYVAFHRRGKFKVYETEKLKQKLEKTYGKS